MIRHVANLSRGLLCPHVVGQADSISCVRIQSTACEQKRWGQVARSLGPTVMMWLAVGHTIVVHDISERPRVTRALWQGVPWIRYALCRAWYDDGGRVLTRSGMDVTAYAEASWRSLTQSERREISYFRRFAVGGPVRLLGCHEARAVTYRGEEARS